MVDGFGAKIRDGKINYPYLYVKRHGHEENIQKDPVHPFLLTRRYFTSWVGFGVPANEIKSKAKESEDKSKDKGMKISQGTKIDKESKGCCGKS